MVLKGGVQERVAADLRAGPWSSPPAGASPSSSWPAAWSWAWVWQGGLSAPPAAACGGGPWVVAAGRCCQIHTDPEIYGQYREFLKVRHCYREFNLDPTLFLRSTSRCNRGPFSGPLRVGGLDIREIYLSVGPFQGRQDPYTLIFEMLFPR